MAVEYDKYDTFAEPRYNWYVPEFHHIGGDIKGEEISAKLKAGCHPAQIVTSLMREQDLMHPTRSKDLVKLVRERYQYDVADKSSLGLESKPTDKLEDKPWSRNLHEFGYESKPWELGKRYKRMVGEVLEAGTYASHMKTKNIPYKCLGDVVLDPRTVFLQTFDKEICLQLIKLYQLRQKQYDDLIRFHGFDSDSEDDLSDHELEPDEIKRRESKIKDVGLDMIKERLAEIADGIHKTRSGFSYGPIIQEYMNIRDEKNKIAQAPEEDPYFMMLQQISETDLFNIDDHMANILKSVDEKKLDILSNKNVQSSRREENLQKRTLYRWKKDIKIKNILKKLQFIYYILCSLVNIKTKQLKSQTLLDQETLKILRRDSFERWSEMSDILDHVREKTSTLASPTVNIASTQSVSFTPTTMSTMDESTKNYHHQTFRKTSLVSPRSRPRKRSERLHKNMNWQDLLNVHPGERAIRKRHKIVLAPWQVSSELAEPVKKEEKKKPEAKKYHPEKAMYNMRVGQLSVKEALLKNQKPLIEKWDRERMMKYRWRLTLTQNVEKNIEIQRKVLKRITEESVKNVQITPESKPPTSPWFRKLVREARRLGFKEHPDVKEILEKIRPFILEDIPLIWSVKEKLCLVTLSMPIEEICSPEVQSAIQFILVEMLDETLNVLEDWLKYRNLYLIKFEPMQFPE